MTDDDALIARLIVKSTPLEREAAARIAELLKRIRGQTLALQFLELQLQAETPEE
jgi:hypothetical protein